MNINLIVVVIAIVWLVVLSGVLLWLVLTLRNLLKGAPNRDFLTVFKAIEDTQTLNNQEIKALKRNLADLQNQVMGHVQKIGLAKYNPFNESGGDHSFSLVLLDGNKNGIIITSLHTRERTRLYTKVVKSGRSEITLSNEETKALSQALK
jgi:predicted phosphohydrolase